LFTAASNDRTESVMQRYDFKRVLLAYLVDTGLATTRSQRDVQP